MTHYADMSENEALREVLQRTTVREAALSLRALAREAGVDEALLRRIRKGERSATHDVARAVADALDRLAERHTRDAASIRHTLDPKRKEGP